MATVATVRTGATAGELATAGAVATAGVVVMVATAGAAGAVVTVATARTRHLLCLTLRAQPAPRSRPTVATVPPATGAFASQTDSRARAKQVRKRTILILVTERPCHRPERSVARRRRGRRRRVVLVLPVAAEALAVGGVAMDKVAVMGRLHASALSHQGVQVFQEALRRTTTRPMRIPYPTSRTEGRRRPRRIAKHWTSLPGPVILLCRRRCRPLLSCYP
ncbi:hypothetical protein I4F81_008622 [Pyropia yezoensis]|uniref:Uncharacterized protein n=1 Tax=Pyropia yezoensis TaxID=2788 RepID=A0ACC3C7E7_PYRYE|nr:hypothetical protein I4F81_008622 [Neopyropia yezoensis]